MCYSKTLGHLRSTQRYNPKDQILQLYFVLFLNAILITLICKEREIGESVVQALCTDAVNQCTRATLDLQNRKHICFMPVRVISIDKAFRYLFSDKIGVGI